jgi:aarF domain-containing kinase
MLNTTGEMLGLTVKGALRIGQTGRVLAGTGVGWLFGDRPPTPRLVRQTFERLGATYVKLGQLIASSPSMFPEPWVTEFQHCLDQTTPLPWRTIRRALKEELGDKLESEFLWVDPEPLASASIAQVHAARLRTGEDVVLKVRKPGVQKVIVTDLNLLHLVARVAERVTPGAAHASLAAIVEEIQGSMMEECDFLREAANIEAFREYLDETLNTQAVAPRVYPKLSTARVLTMERFFGVPLTDAEGLRRCTDDPEELLLNALNTWFGSLMHCRTFHADLHAGNLMALRDGRIGFIDFGIVGRIREETWRAMFALGKACRRATSRRSPRGSRPWARPATAWTPRALRPTSKRCFGGWTWHRRRRGRRTGTQPTRSRPRTRISTAR